MATVLPHMIWPYCEFRMQLCCTRLAENTGQKIRHLCTIAQLCRAIEIDTKVCIDNTKKLLNSNISSTCSRNMVNFSPAWGTPGPANFNGFPISVSLLHRPISSIQQRALPIFDWAAITLGIGPRSSSVY